MGGQRAVSGLCAGFGKLAGRQMDLRSPNSNALVHFEVLVLDACLVDFDALDRNDTFFWSEEPRRSRRVREKEPNEEGKDVPIRTEKRRTRRRWRRLM